MGADGKSVTKDNALWYVCVCVRRTVDGALGDRAESDITTTMVPMMARWRDEGTSTTLR